MHFSQLWQMECFYFRIRFEVYHKCTHKSFHLLFHFLNIYEFCFKESFSLKKKPGNKSLRDKLVFSHKHLFERWIPIVKRVVLIFFMDLFFWNSFLLTLLLLLLFIHLFWKSETQGVITNNCVLKILKPSSIIFSLEVEVKKSIVWRWVTGD